MLNEDTKYSPVRNQSQKHGFSVSRVKAFVALFVFVSLMIVVIVLAVMLAREKAKEEHVCRVKDDAGGSGSSLSPMSCDVIVVGGGISGLYMAETLVRKKKEHEVCLFEQESRFGGRVYDVSSSRAPNVSLSLGAWRVTVAYKTIMGLARRFNIQMLKMPTFKVDYLEARGVYASNFQSVKEQAFPTLLSSRFANMTSSEMLGYAWMNMSKGKALEFPSYPDFICHRVGSEGCAFLDAIYNTKVDYGNEQSTLYMYERSKAISAEYSSQEFVRPTGGLPKLFNALETSAKQLGVKMYTKEKVNALSRKGKTFAVQTDHFLVSAKKLIIAAPVSPLKEITGDVASEIQRNRVFKSILTRSSFRAVAIYKYPWWENATSSHNITLKPWNGFVSGATCLGLMMPYGDQGPNGEGIIQLVYGMFGCAVKWGELSKLPKAVFHSELNKAVQAVFPGTVVPEPLDIVFKYWENTCWHQTKAGSNVSRYDVEEWAKRPFPGEEVYLVGEAFSVIDGWTEGALLSAYNALKEGWGIAQPEP